MAASGSGLSSAYQRLSNLMSKLAAQHARAALQGRSMPELQTRALSRASRTRRQPSPISATTAESGLLGRPARSNVFPALLAARRRPHARRAAVRGRLASASRHFSRARTTARGRPATQTRSARRGFIRERRTMDGRTEGTGDTRPSSAWRGSIVGPQPHAAAALDRQCESDLRGHAKRERREREAISERELRSAARTKRSRVARAPRGARRAAPAALIRTPSRESCNAYCCGSIDQAKRVPAVAVLVCNKD